MPNKIAAIPPFTREAKRLGKKYSSLDADLKQLFTKLQSTPVTGTALGQNCYKIRLKVASKGQGSSGGACVITCVVAVAETIYLLSIYDKSEQDSLSDKRLQELLQLIPSAPAS